MKLKSFGCSFIWGSEMADADPLPSQSSWPALLAKYLSLPYECYARPGGGNLLIAEQVLNQVALPGQDSKSEPSIFVVNWTYIDRFDYANPANDQWNTITPSGDRDGQQALAAHYYRNLHSQYRDKLTTLMHIKLCIDSLLQAGHQFIMTYMDSLLFETEYHCSPAVKRLQHAIKPYMRNFNGMNMVQYSMARGHQTTDRAHPLESAHRDMYDYALAFFDIHKIKTT